MRFPVLISILLLPCGIAAAQQTERYTIDGDDVAVYNLAGTLQVESGPGRGRSPGTRGGADAAKLKVVQGEIAGRETCA